jgi:hypothetical protein
MQAPPADFSHFTVEVDATTTARECALYALPEFSRLHNPSEAAVSVTIFADTVVAKAETDGGLRGANAMKDGQVSIMAKFEGALTNVLSKNDLQASIAKLDVENVAFNAAWVTAEAEQTDAEAATTAATELLEASYKTTLDAARMLVSARAKGRTSTVRMDYAKGSVQAISLVRARLSERLTELESMEARDAENRSKVQEALDKVNFLGDSMAETIMRFISEEMEREAREEGA